MANMSLYAIDKLIEETRRLAAEFRRTTGTMLPVSGEIARYDVSQHLDLELTDDRTCGFDAIGRNKRDGLRILIKSRVVGDTLKSGHRIGQLNPDGNWDLVILSLMNNDLNPWKCMKLRTRRLLRPSPAVIVSAQNAVPSL